MIGQTKLLKKLNRINSLDELPKSIIIRGDSGSGKHVFSNMIIDKFGVDSEIIDYELTLDVLNDMYALSIPKFYIIDFKTLKEHKVIERFQNTLLKFIEEPPEFAWIILLVSSRDEVLETIYNRCQVYKLSPYSLDELRQIAEMNGKNYSDRLLRLLKVPGNIVSDNVSQVDTLIGLSNMMIDMLNKATPANALSIDKKFFGDNPLDLDLFLLIMLDNLFTKYTETNNNKHYKAFMITHKLFNDLSTLNVNKKDLFDNYLLRLKEVFND